MERMREQRVNTKLKASFALGRLRGWSEEMAGEYSRDKPTRNRWLLHPHVSADTDLSQLSSRLIANTLPFLSVKIRIPGHWCQRYLRRSRSLDSYKTALHLVFYFRAIIQPV
jgi:hypothetical protein